jgi:hypothetical protein
MSFATRIIGTMLRPIYNATPHVIQRPGPGRGQQDHSSSSTRTAPLVPKDTRRSHADTLDVAVKISECLQIVD